MKRLFSAFLCALFVLSASNFRAVANPVVSSVQMTDEDDKSESNDKDKKDKKDKKKDKKDKKDKKKKERRAPQEILNDLKNIEWTKPAASGIADYDKMFDTADDFMKMLKNVDERVAIYSIRVVTNAAGDSILAPVDAAGNIRNKKEANEQTLAAVAYGTEVGLTASSLALEVAANAVNIAQDAIPLVGDANRKKANVQIAKATSGFKLLKELIGTQRKIMEKYLATNSNLSSGDVDVEALTEMNVNVDDVLTLSDDDFNALWEQENGE